VKKTGVDVRVIRAVEAALSSAIKRIAVYTYGGLT